MAESDSDILSRLLEVESAASLLVDEAGAEASRRVLNAKAQADELYHSKYLSAVGQLENQFNQNVQNYQKQHDADFEQYTNNLKQKAKDTGAFNAFMNKTLFNA